MSHRGVRTLVGDIRYSRVYYHCRDCGASRCPLDEELGQSRRDISAGVERALACLSAHLAFATASDILAGLARVSLSSRQVESVAEALGREAGQLERESAQQALNQGLALAPTGTCGSLRRMASWHPCVAVGTRK